MISLDTYYSSSQFKGTSGSNLGREGYVPQAKIGESGNYLRGDGKWIDFGLANLTSTYTTVRSLSDSWEESASITPLQTASASWDSVYTTTNTNSGKWESNYTSFNTNSAKYDSVYTTTNSNSAFYILSGGNTNNSNFSIGSNDAYNFSLETNNTNRISVLSSGETIFLTTSNLLSTSLPFVEVKGGEAIGTDIISLSSFNTPTGYSPGQLSVNSLLVGQNDLGNYIGRTNVTENIFCLSSISIGTNFINKFNIAGSNVGNFYDLAISSDGRCITIANYSFGIYPNNQGGCVYVSTDFGNTFTARITDDGTRRFPSIAMSSDGRVQLATAYGVVGGGLFISEDYGLTWVNRNTNILGNGVDVSSDGRIQAVAVGVGSGSSAGTGIYISYDYGINWSRKLPVDSTNFYRVKMSSDGKIFLAISTSGVLYTSYDYGNTWVLRNINRSWLDIAISADGKNQTACVNSGTGLGIYVSNNFGITWTNTYNFSDPILSVCMTSCGRYQFATRTYSTSPFTSNGYVLKSSDYGATWTTLTSGPQYYANIKCSSDSKVLGVIRTQYSGTGSSLDLSYAPAYSPSTIVVPGGNSLQWNSNYTTVNSNSANWSSVYTSFNSNSAKYDSNFTTVNSNSGRWESVYTSFNSNSGKYDSSWTTTNSNSANWTQIRSIQTSDFTASQGSYYIVNTTSTPITGALPVSPSIGTTITFQDSFIQWQKNNFTLNRSGNMIQGLNENMICDRGGVMFSVTYIGGSVGWRVN